MEQIKSINPERIVWCCADRGITTNELADEVGIAVASLARVMSGDGGITFNQLRKVAEYFGRGVLFFLELGPVDETLIRSPQFRTLANQKPELSPRLKSFIERVDRQRAVYVSLLEDLDEVDRVQFKPLELQTNSSLEAAKATRIWLKLSGKNDFESYRNAVEAKGILVFVSNGYNGKWQIAKESPILGFTLYDPSCPVIVVKKQFSEARQSFTLMHELGHLLLHKKSWIDDDGDFHSTQKAEREANAFAGYVLVPEDALRSVDDKTKPSSVSELDNWLSELCKELGVSTEVILRRLLDSGRFQLDQYQKYRQWRDRPLPSPDPGGSRIYRNREPKHIFGDRFVRTVLDSLSARQITLAKASTYLDSIKVSDIHKLERHYAGL
jgi:Zn-dependent peptidase ImmA (M78 family)